MAQTPDGGLYVPLRPLTDFLGLASGPQRRRVARDEVLAEGARLVVMQGADGRQRELLCLPLDMLPGGLFGIQPTRVRPALADKLKRYRAECFRVLWQAFKGDVLPTAPTQELSGAALALEIATAVQHLARQQLELEQRHNTMAEYMRGFVPGTRRTLARHAEHIGALEIQLSAGATISETQAAEIALAVKNVANALDGVGISNPYARVYSEMYQRYHVSSYKNLPSAQYEAMRTWLAGWHDEVQDANSST